MGVGQGRWALPRVAYSRKHFEPVRNGREVTQAYKFSLNLKTSSSHVLLTKQRQFSKPHPVDKLRESFLPGFQEYTAYQSY